MKQINSVSIISYALLSCRLVQTLGVPLYQDHLGEADRRLWERDLANTLTTSATSTDTMISWSTSSSYTTTSSLPALGAPPPSQPTSSSTSSTRNVVRESTTSVTPASSSVASSTTPTQSTSSTPTDAPNPASTSSTLSSSTSTTTSSPAPVPTDTSPPIGNPNVADLAGLQPPGNETASPSSNNSSSSLLNSTASGTDSTQPLYKAPGVPMSDMPVTSTSPKSSGKTNTQASTLLESDSGHGASTGANMAVVVGVTVGIAVVVLGALGFLYNSHDQQNLNIFHYSSRGSAASDEKIIMNLGLGSSIRSKDSSRKKYSPTSSTGSAFSGPSRRPVGRLNIRNGNQGSSGTISVSSPERSATDSSVVTSAGSSTETPQAQPVPDVNNANVSVSDKATPSEAQEVRPVLASTAQNVQEKSPSRSENRLSVATTSLYSLYSMSRHSPTSPKTSKKVSSPTSALSASMNRTPSATKQVPGALQINSVSDRFAMMLSPRNSIISEKAEVNSNSGTLENKSSGHVTPPALAEQQYYGQPVGYGYYMEPYAPSAEVYYIPEEPQARMSLDTYQSRPSISMEPPQRPLPPTPVSFNQSHRQSRRKSNLLPSMSLFSIPETN